MKTIDRMLLLSYLKAYLFCLVSLLSLYVVVDLFTNLEDFAHGLTGLMPVLKRIGTYYGYKVSQIFDRLCEAIVLLAATFTVAWVQRNNELLPLLSAGVSTRRVIRPVLVGAVLMLGLGVANQELVIPKIAHFLKTDRGDPEGNGKREVPGGFDRNGVHIEGFVGSRRDLSVESFHVLIPETIASGLLHVSAEMAYYVPPGRG